MTGYTVNYYLGNLFTQKRKDVYIVYLNVDLIIKCKSLQIRKDRLTEEPDPEPTLDVSV